MKYDLKENIVIFSDLDGTALNGQNQFSQVTIDIVKKLYDKNMLFFPITARSTSDALRQAKILGIDKYNGIVAGNNGAQIYDFKNQNWIYNYYIPSNLVKTIFEKTFGEIGRYKVHYFADDITYVYGEGHNSSYWSDIMQVEYKVISSFEEIKKPITHLTIILAKNTSDENIKNFQDDFTLLYQELDIIKYTRRVYEVCGKGINKGFAVQKIKEYLNLQKENTTSFGFGDSHNDFDLFDKVDYGIAMGNGLKELFHEADGTTLTNDNDGVANFIEKYIFKKGE